MAQYYQIQTLDELKQIYADVQVLHVASDDVGASSSHNRSQQMLLQDDQILLNDGQQVVYQTTAANQPQYQQPGTTHFIIGDDIAQQQQQQQQQQQPQHQQVMLQQHQTIEHHQQQQAQTQQAQQHYQQQEAQQPQVQQMQQQDHQLQHVQQQTQQQPQPQQIYYTTDQILQQNTIVQHSPHAQQQEIQQQQQQQQQQLHVQQQYQQQQQIVHQQHAMPSTQQVQVQQQPQQQVVYRMQTQQQQQSPAIHQQTQMLNNAHVIVQQQPSGQQVIIQPQHQEMLMRQPMRIYTSTPHHNTNRVIYSAQQPPQTHAIIQQSPQHQQQHIQLQASPLHTQARLVQTRVGTQAPQSQQGVVFHQIQTGQKTVQQQQQQLQIQQQPQLVSTTGVMRGGVRPKTSRGGLITSIAPGLTPRMPAARAVVRPIISTAGAGQTLKTPRPRSSATASGSTRARGGARGGRGGMAAGRGGSIAASAAAAAGIQVMGQPQQQQTQLLGQQGKNITITNLNQQSVSQIYRQVVDKIIPAQQHQQLQLVQTQQRALTAQHMRSPPIGTPPQAQIQSSPTTSTSSGNFELDLEDSIQAVVVKKDQQKPVGTAIANPMGTTLTTYYTKEDDDKRYVHTQNGTCMTVTEFKKRIPNTNPAVAPVGTMRSIIPMRAGGPPPNTSNSSPKLSAGTGNQVPVARVAPQKISQQVPQQQQPQQTAEAMPQATSSSVYKTSHNNYEIQTQHVLQNRSNQQMAEKDRNSAKMLVILVSGEQRLITFTLPRESCTVQDLLEQVGVPFDNTTTIQCVENPGANIDFVVTVGFSVMESASELISRAEQSLQLTRQPDMAASAAAAAAAVSSATGGVNTSAAAAAAYNSLTANTSAATAASASSAGVDESAKEATASTSSSASNATAANKLAEEVPRKTIQGFFAICQSCGFSGYDHAKCERCKRVFLEPPKRVPLVKSSGGNATAGDGPAMPRLASDLADKKRSGDIIPRGSKGGVPYSPNSSGRGRGGAGSRGRTRSGRRTAEAEPVILTLSSDEEGDDDTSSKTSANVSAAISSHNSGLLPMTYKPFAFEPMMPEKDETPIYAEFKRGDITDLSDCTDKLSTTLQCKLIRIGGTMRFEPLETVTFTSKGIRIVAPLENDENKSFALHIHKHEVVKIIAHFSKTSESMLCFYTLRLCAKYIKTSLNMKTGYSTDGHSYFDPNGPYQMRKIILQFDSISDQARNVIKSIWDFFDEISVTDAQDLLQRAAYADSQLSSKTNDVPMNTTTQLNPNEIRQLLIYPPGKGGISINTEDYMCLATDQYLNDIIIDFYLKWVHNKLMPEHQRAKTFVFSTFFYKRLTTLTRHQQPDKDVKQTAAQKRHARVQNWTKNVNLFDKDFIIIPINEQSHWFLAIICFPQLKGPVTFDTNMPVDPQQIKKQKGKKVSLQIGNTTITPLSKRESVNANVLAEVCGVGDEDSERDEAEGDDSDLASEDSDFENGSSATNTTAPTATSTPAPPVPSAPAVVPAAATANAAQSQAIKQPLILIFDSLAGASRSRVVATLRDYLTCEYKMKMGGDAAPHTFNKDNMPGHCVKVPQQNNFTDCGLYLLQYVEHFFKEPIRDYRLPIKQLSNWFDTITVTRKREEISVLLQQLMNEKNGPTQKLILPEIPFPTLNGQLVEPPEGYNIEFEEGEMEEEAVEEEEENSLKVGAADIDMPGEENSQLIAKTTTAALVPTQGRRIVVKRRLQVPSGHSEASPSNPANVRNSLVKIRKIEQ